MRNENLRASIWFIALFVLSAWTIAGWFRPPPGTRLDLPTNPFQETAGLKEEHWRFLEQVREVLPVDATYTIRAATTADEMSLFMLAGFVLHENIGVPSSYYDRPIADGTLVKWILSYRCDVVPPDATVIVDLPDGCICERGE